MYRALQPAAAILLLSITAVASARADSRAVPLRSGAIEPGRQAGPARIGESDDPLRYVVRFHDAPGWSERGRLQGVGAKVEAPLPGQAYLVSLPAAKAAELARIPGVDWAAPLLAADKISPEIAAVKTGPDAPEKVVVLLQLFADAQPKLVAAELAAAGFEVAGAGRGSRFGRLVMLMSPAEVESSRELLAERNDVFWVARRHRRVLSNDDVVWVDQSGLDAGQTTPVHDHGVHGEGQIGAVLDTGLDADTCYFRDDALGLPPTNVGGGTVVDMNQRKVIAVDFLDPAEDPADPTHWDTQGHGSHVTGTFVGDDLANPIAHDAGDGMAPGAKVVVQDAGYAPDDCADLPGIGCPVTDLTPIFQQAYDQGARVHSNSWNDNENAAVQNTYTDASEDVDAFTWDNPDFLVMIGAGNHALGGFGTMGSPGTCKNGMSVGATYNGASAIYLSDISAWGPTDDGRIKPDILSPGASIQSCRNDHDVTTNNCDTQGSTGTSMATPGAGGAALLVRQYFADGFYPSGAANPADGFDPTAALVKATLINSATPIFFNAEGQPIEVPGVEQGWGRVLLDDALYFAGNDRGLWIDEYGPGFNSDLDAPVNYVLEVAGGSEPLKITLVWSDYPSTPAASVHLVNDLDLRVDGPGGGWWGNAYRNGASWPLGGADRLNNVEQVEIPLPDPGLYSIQVAPHAIPVGPQGYALVVSGGGISVSAGPRPGYWAHTVDDSGPGGNGDGVLDPGERAVVPVTLRNSGDADATAVAAALFSALPDTLKVYRSTASYADIAVNDAQTSAQPHHEVVLEPSANCGDWVGASMAISGDGFELGSGFTMEVGLYEGDRPSTDTPIEIPRSSDVGVYSFLNVPATFPVTEVDVTVDIDHPDISDLRVVLYAPDNTLVFLHDRGDPGVSGLHTTYDELTQPVMGSMDSFVGIDPQGTWRLRVIDYTGGPAGTLENWTLHFKSDIPFNCNPVGCGEAVPPAVGDTLTVSKSAGTDVQVAWTGVGAGDYNVWRAADAGFATAIHVGATGGATSLIDTGVQALPSVHYYQARSVNSCRWESE
jgi:subtilisin-like proprotein convertase family protein